MANLNLLDVAKLNGNDKVVGLIEENLTYAPELSVIPARVIKGTSYTTITRTGFPTVGFRNANEGVATSKSSLTKKLCEMFILGGAINVDKAVGEAHEDGLAALEMFEADGVMKASVIKLGAQFFYGTTSDAKGFTGVKAATPFGGTTVLNSGGSDANVQTSLYAVKFGLKDVHLITGNNATFSLSEFRDQQLLDASNNPYPGRVADLMAWVGLQIGNVNCVGRIANIGQDSETGDTLTDAKIAQLLQKFPVGYKPDKLFANRRSVGQLQRSRTVTLNASANTRIGADVENVAPWPESAFGIPLITTDSILSTDAVET